MRIYMQYMSDKRQWLTPKQFAKEYDIGLSTLAKLRLTGGGAAYAKLGVKVLYNRDDIEAWLKSKRVAHTSQYAA